MPPSLLLLFWLAHALYPVQKKAPDPDLLGFLDESVGEPVGTIVSLDAALDESEISFKPRWTAYSFHYSIDQGPAVRGLFRVEGEARRDWSQGMTRSVCEWSALPDAERPARGAALVTGEFVGRHDRGIYTMLDARSRRGWICLRRGD